MVDYDKYVMENNRPIAQIKHGIVIRFIYMMWGANLTREDLSPWATTNKPISFEAFIIA